MCGEGGEYETFVIDSPLYLNKINVEKTQTIIHSDNTIAPVAYLKLDKFNLISK